MAMLVITCHNQRVYCWILIEVGIIKQQIIAHYHFLPTLEGQHMFIARLPSMCQVGYLQMEQHPANNNHDANVSAPLPTFGNLQKGMSNINCKKKHWEIGNVYYIYIYIHIYIYYVYMCIYIYMLFHQFLDLLGGHEWSRFSQAAVLDDRRDGGGGFDDFGGHQPGYQGVPRG